MVDRIELRQWTTTDRSTLETTIENTDEFISSFVATLLKLLFHDFIAKQQSEFLRESKDKLEVGQFVIDMARTKTDHVTFWVVLS